MADLKKKKEAPTPTNGGEGDNFPKPDGCLMIFGGLDAYELKRWQKLTNWEVNTIELAIPTYLEWSESAITFDRLDHPSLLRRPGRFPLVVDPIIKPKCLSKVLMYGGSSLNIH